MNGCPTLTPDGTAGIGEALRVVDCVSANAAASAFGRLFGPDGGLGTALTLLLTLYVGLLAVNLLTGRSRLGLNMLTPRMLVLGLVLTFATSWMAYQSVVWTLLTGAPDQIASVITGEQGSATAAFASRLDTLFGAVASAAEAANTPAAVSPVTGITPAPPQAAGWTAGDVLWLAAMLLLLGTVGVLLVARIALAALLAVGPVFIVLALFRGTHGLFVGWLKGAVMFAVVPLFTVLIGGAALALLGPVVADLGAGTVTMGAAVTMFLGASVYVTLMVIVLKVSGTLVAGWRIGQGGPAQASDGRSAGAPAAPAVAAGAPTLDPVLAASAGTPAASPAASERVREIGGATRVPAHASGALPAGDRRAALLTSATRSQAREQPSASALPRDRRVSGVGARFRTPPPPTPGKLKT
jgi:type IV secretion system protein VirB6